MPVVHPAEVWKESGRYAKIGPELVRFKDRGERDMVLAMTHEEVVAILLRDIVQSYRQLPMIVYHFQTKFRDEPRSRGGLIRVREFVMKDSYSCDVDAAGLDVSYDKHYAAYEKIFRRLGLDAIPVRSDVGIMGGSGAHEFMVVNDFGEDTLVLCDNVRLRRQPADRGRRQARSGARGPPADGGRRDAGRRRRSIRSARFLGIPKSKTAKAAFFVTGDGRFVVAIVRGDYDVNETKLANLAQGDSRTPAGDGRGDQGARHGGGLRLAHRRPRCRRRRRRAGRPLAEPCRGRQPGGLARQERERAPRLRAGPHRRDHERPRGRSLPSLRLDGEAPKGDRGRQHLQARNRLHGRLRVDVPGRGRRAASHRHGLVRHRPRPQRGLHRRGAPRREGHRLAGPGGSRMPRTWSRSAPPASRACPRSPSASTRSRPRPAPSARSCRTTATSRPGSSSPMPSCSACPGS